VGAVAVRSMEPRVPWVSGHGVTPYAVTGMLTSAKHQYQAQH